MTGKAIEAGAHPGDWVSVHVIGGGAPRRGQILEVIGRPGHVRYRVRWDEQHESIHFPSEGTSIEHPDAAPAHGSASESQPSRTSSLR